MSNIYVCYHQDDSKFAGSLTKRLETRGYHIYTRQNATPGKSISQEIAGLIYQCHAFIIVLSNRAVTSKEMAKELNYAVGQGKQILPIVTESVTYPGNMAYILRPMTPIDARQLGTEEVLDRLVNVLPQPVYQPRRAGLGSGGKIALYGIIGVIVLAAVAALIIFIPRLISSPTPEPWVATQAPSTQQTSPVDAPAPSELPVAAMTTLRLGNGWSVNICEVYISPVGSDQWGEDLLGPDGWIYPNYFVDFAVPVGTYNLRIVACTVYRDYKDYPPVQVTQPLTEFIAQ